jgi:hypothetical protein
VPKTPPDLRLVVVRAKSGADVSGLVGGVKPTHGDYLLRVPGGSATASYAAELAATGKFAYAVPEQVSYPLGSYTSTPNDPDFTDAENSVGIPYSESWWERGIGSPAFSSVWPHLTPDGAAIAYDARATAAQIKVGVIDTGYYMATPDTGPNIVAGKDEFAKYSSKTGFTTDANVNPVTCQLDPECGHGTMVASEVAQNTNNGIGGAGAAWDTTVRIYKVEGIDTGTGQAAIYNAAINNAIYDATNDGCRVINISLGSTTPDVSEQTAINYAWSHGVVVCAATGNDATSSVYYPAACSHVLGIGSYNPACFGGGIGTAAVRSSFANWGTGLDLLAPGDYIWGPGVEASGPGYGWWAGTSCASPLAAAEAALILRFAPSLGPDDVATVMESSADYLTGQTGYSTAYGWGRIDMLGAWSLLKSQYPNLARPIVSGAPSSGYTASRSVSLSWPAVPGYAVSYAVSRDGATAATSTATTAALYSLTDGLHTVTITPVSDRNWSAGSAVTVTFTVDTVAPAAPSVSWSAGTGRVSWSTPETGGTTQFALDGTGGPTTVTGTSLLLPAGTALGPHTAYVRITDLAGNVGAWGSASFALTAPTAISSVLSITSAPSMTLAYGWQAKLTGSLVGSDTVPVGGAAVALSASTDGGNSWTPLTTVTTDAGGAWSASFVPGRNELVRATYAGDATHTAGTSGTTVSLAQLVYLSTPSTPGTVRHGHAFTTYTYLKPRFSSGSHPVTVRFYRYEKHGGTYTWTLRKTASMKAANYSSCTRASASTSVPYAGKWRAIATYGGSSAWAATTSGTRSFTAR